MCQAHQLLFYFQFLTSWHKMIALFLISRVSELKGGGMDAKALSLLQEAALPSLRLRTAFLPIRAPREGYLWSQTEPGLAWKETGAGQGR